MDGPTARALSGFFIAISHALPEESASLAGQILLRLADETHDEALADLYRSTVFSVTHDAERDPLPDQTMKPTRPVDYAAAELQLSPDFNFQDHLQGPLQFPRFRAMQGGKSPKGSTA
jgi:hypothetical protein